MNTVNCTCLQRAIAQPNEGCSIWAIMKARSLVCCVLIQTGSAIIAEEIKSIDGKVIEAQVLKVDAVKDQVELLKDGKLFEVPLARLDPATAGDLLTRHYVELKRDRFTGSASVELKESLRLNTRERAQVIGHVSGAAEGYFHLIIYHLVENWEWLEFSKTTLLLNGVERMPVTATLTTDVVKRDPHCYEAASILFTPKEFARIAHAAKLEIRVGITELELSLLQIRMLKVLHARWQLETELAERSATTASQPGK